MNHEYFTSSIKWNFFTSFLSLLQHLGYESCSKIAKQSGSLPGEMCELQTGHGSGTVPWHLKKSSYKLSHPATHTHTFVFTSSKAITMFGLHPHPKKECQLSGSAADRDWEMSFCYCWSDSLLFHLNHSWGGLTATTNTQTKGREKKQNPHNKNIFVLFFLFSHRMKLKHLLKIFSVTDGGLNEGHGGWQVEHRTQSQPEKCWIQATSPTYQAV